MSADQTNQDHLGQVLGFPDPEIRETRSMSDDSIDLKGAMRDLPRAMAIRHLKAVGAKLQTEIDRLEELGELYDAQVEFAIVRGVIKMAADVVGFVSAGLKRKL